MSEKYVRPVRKSSGSAKKRVLLALAGVVFVVGLFTVVQKVASWLPSLAKPHKTATGNVKVNNSLEIKKADFNYLVPGTDDAWTFDEGSVAFDSSTGVVKYAVKMKYSGATVTFSQQTMPGEFKPRQTNNKFMAFINSANPTRSQDAGEGTVYFLAAMQNGAAANGADTVIYATDDILMFGKTGQIVGYDGWAKLVGSMQPH